MVLYQSVDIPESFSLRQTLPIMSVIRDLEEFARAHGRCGGICGDAEKLTADGYLVWLACTCSGMFERWVTPESAVEEIEGWTRHVRN